MRVADYIIEILKSEGVGFVSTFPGDNLLSLYDALYECSEIPLILTRHEQGAVYIADGYARSTGEPGVAFITKGPGRTNAFTAIVNAFTDCTPLVIIFAHASRKLLGKGLLQELPYLETFASMVKWTFSIPTPERVPEAFRRAFTVARSGRPGPVILEVTEDLLKSEIDRIPYVRTRRVRFAPDPEDLDRALALLGESRHPLLYVGRGGLYAEATEQLIALAETFSVPVMTTLAAKGVIPEDHPFCLGLGGYPRASYNTGPALKYAEETDLVIALGCSFRQHATSTWLPKPEKTRLIQVDVDPAELHKNYNADLAILSDIKLFLQALLKKAPEVIGSWRSGMEKPVAEDIRALKKQWRDSWQPRLKSDEVPINPYRICWDLGQLLDRNNTIMLHDSGTTRAYISYHYETLFPGGFIGFGATSAMGWSTPAAIGVKLAHPEKTVVNVSGDGSFGMTGMEIETAARHGIKTLTVILNNQALHATREAQTKRFPGREIGIALGGDYAMIARGLGAYGERIEKPGDLPGALTRALNHPGPAVLEVLIKPYEPRPGEGKK